MPGTGSNKQFTEKILSIRISPDGLSFWMDDKIVPAEWNSPEMRVLSPSASGEKRVDIDTRGEEELARLIKGTFYEEQLPKKKIVYIDTMKTVFVPAPIYAEAEMAEGAGAAAAYLRLNNIPVNEDEQTDVSLPIHGTVAIMVTPKMMMRALGQHLGEFAVASPMQYNIIRIPDGVKLKGKKYKKTVIYISDSSVYISIFSVTEGGFDRLVYSEVLPMLSHADLLYYLTTLDIQFGIRKYPVCIKGVGAENALSFIRKRYKKAKCG